MNTEVKLCHLKVAPPNKVCLSYPQCFNVSRVHSLVRVLFTTNPIPEVPLARILLLKLGQTYPRFNYPKYCSRISDSFSQKLCAGKIIQASSVESGTNQTCQGGAQGNVVERCNTASITLQKSASKRDRGNRPVINLKYLNSSSHTSISKWRG